MSKKLTVGNESFNYPITGTNNYGEGASDWAESITDAVAEFFGPGDIRTQEQALTAGASNANIPNLLFDMAYVQRVRIEGFVVRTTTGNIKTREAFVVEGISASNGTSLNISIEWIGDDTDIVLGTTGGQFTYTDAADAGVIADTTELKIKFAAKTQIDETAV
jgi:hypothetical protein